jgi:hypothetical protein
MSEEMIDQACQTPLVELLERVPADARMTYEHSPTHHQMIPVGRLCHEAAASLRVSAYNPNERLREAAEHAREQILNELHTKLSYPTEACAVVRGASLSPLPQGGDT